MYEEYKIFGGSSNVSKGGNPKVFKAHASFCFKRATSSACCNPKPTSTAFKGSGLLNSGHLTVTRRRGAWRSKVTARAAFLGVENKANGVTGLIKGAKKIEEHPVRDLFVYT